MRNMSVDLILRKRHGRNKLLVNIQLLYLRIINSVIRLVIAVRRIIIEILQLVRAPASCQIVWITKRDSVENHSKIIFRRSIFSLRVFQGDRESLRLIFNNQKTLWEYYSNIGSHSKSISRRLKNRAITDDREIIININQLLILTIIFFKT